MKRAAASLFLLLAATAAHAIDTSHRGDRIGVLAAGDPMLCDFLRQELSGAGFQAFDAKHTYEELQREGLNDADYYVEIVTGDSAHPLGGMTVGGDNAAVDVSVVRSEVAGEVRLYDGRTMQLLTRFALHKSKTSVMPTGVGIGGRHLFGWIVVPIVQAAQYRNAAHAVAHDAATQVAAFHKDEGSRD
jgi:hypothetical protein